MSRYFSTLLLIIFIHFGAKAQSGAHFSTGISHVNQDFLQTEEQFSGWNIRLAARLGSGIWFFAPELNYENYNILPSRKRNPFADNVRIHTLKIPLGIGWKFRILPTHKIFVKGGIMGSYVLAIEENDSINFRNIVDTYGGYYGTVGYDFGWFTIDYRYEKSIMDNYKHIPESKLLFQSVSMGINF